MTQRPPSGASSQARKLGLSDGTRVWLEAAPIGWSFDDPPAGLAIVGNGQDVDVVLSFFTAADDLRSRLPDLSRVVYPDGALWVCWPRRAGGHRSDITDNIVRGHALPLGLVDTKVAAVDSDWSALRLVWRRQLRHDP